MLAEAMIAARGVASVKSFGGHSGSGGGSRGGASSGGVPGSGTLKGGLAGVVSRSFQNNAVKNATGSKEGGLGGKAFASSLEKGGGFANRIIGTVAAGDLSTTGSMTGEKRPPRCLPTWAIPLWAKTPREFPAFPMWKSEAAGLRRRKPLRNIRRGSP